MNDEERTKSMLLLVYGVSQLSAVLLELFKQRHEVTNEQLQQMWKDAVGEFDAAKDLWMGHRN